MHIFYIWTWHNETPLCLKSCPKIQIVNSLQAVVMNKQLLRKFSISITHRISVHVHICKVRSIVLNSSFNEANWYLGAFWKWSKICQAAYHHCSNWWCAPCKWKGINTLDNQSINQTDKSKQLNNHGTAQ